MEGIIANLLYIWPSDHAGPALWYGVPCWPIAGVVPQRAVVPHGPCLLLARAWPTAQGTVHGLLGRVVLPIGHSQFCRAGPARSLFKRES